MMKLRLKWSVAAAVASLGLAGCGHVDFTPSAEGDSGRVLTGTVEARGTERLPAGTVVVVRVVDPARPTDKAPSAVLGEPSSVPLQSTLPPKVLGSQEIRNPGQFPVPFRIEYTAMDEQLRRGLILEARVSYGGAVRFFNVSSYAVTLGNFADPHPIFVNRL